MRTPTQVRKDRRRRREIAEAVRGEWELEPRRRFDAMRRMADNVASFERKRVSSHSAMPHTAAPGAPASGPAAPPQTPARSTERPIAERQLPPRGP